MTILRLSCSPNGTSSESFRLSQIIVDELLGSDPTIKREVSEVDSNFLSHVDATYASALGAAADPDSYEGGSLGRSDRLIQSLADASWIVIATPMHNYTVPSSLKAWIDHVVRVRRTFEATPKGKIGALPDRPVFVAVSSGAAFSGEDARQPDFLTPYLKAALATIGLERVTFFSVQGSARGLVELEKARTQARAAVAEHFRCAGRYTKNFNRIS